MRVSEEERSVRGRLSRALSLWRMLSPLCGLFHSVTYIAGVCHVLYHLERQVLIVCIVCMVCLLLLTCKLSESVQSIVRSEPTALIYT